MSQSSKSVDSVEVTSSLEMISNTVDIKKVHMSSLQRYSHVVTGVSLLSNGYVELTFGKPIERISNTSETIESREGDKSKCEEVLKKEEKPEI
jgi:hypothetical protein